MENAYGWPHLKLSWPRRDAKILADDVKPYESRYIAPILILREMTYAASNSSMDRGTRVILTGIRRRIFVK